MEHPLGQASPQSPTYKGLGPICEAALKGECHNLRTGGYRSERRVIVTGYSRTNFFRMNQESSAVQLGLAHMDRQWCMRQENLSRGSPRGVSLLSAVMALPVPTPFERPAAFDHGARDVS